GVKNNLENSIIEIGINNLPIQYLNFITETDGAKLFYDEAYGQAGLYLYETDVIKSKNLEWRKSYLNQDLLPTDLIIGEFFGDSDLVILRCDENSKDYGDIIISLPLDERKDWYFLTSNFEHFLIKFCDNEGIKYWEFSNSY
ncbi:SMI1/KNR4 family protein, partial [Ursidibacter sp. B-7004-1]